MNNDLNMILRRTMLHLVIQEGGEIVIHADQLDVKDTRLVYTIKTNPDRIVFNAVSIERHDELLAMGAIQQ